MSHWVSLKCQCCGNTMLVDMHSEGGTYAIGGTDEASLNVTYNYSKHIYQYVEGGLYSLNGKKALDTIEDLKRAVEGLGTERSNDYWEATPGNAGYALSILLNWAVQYPDAVWKVS